MGHLKNGKWHSGNVATSNEEGEFKREQSLFRSWIKPDSEFEPEKNRYHLYVGYACPWAHRTLITLYLKNLNDYISYDVVAPDMLEHSWSFDTDFPATTGDRVNQKKYLYEVYQLSQKDVTSKVTIPVLWDKKSSKIVNNESSEIIRMFNELEFGSGSDLYPPEYQLEIDKFNEEIYGAVNNGVYKTGFAKSQKAYETSFITLFKKLDELEDHLKGREFLVSDQITEADVRLITTLLRFDCVYYSHFKCNLRRISDYKNLHRYVQNLYRLEAVQKTTNFEHIKRHYYYSHEFLNPSRIVPIGPEFCI